MKFIKKFFLLIATVALVASLGLNAFASESAENASEDTENSYTDTDSSSKNLDTGGEVNDTDENIDNAGENPFEVIFQLICNYSGEIFSALAFLGTLIVAHFYKRGMLPALRSALGNVSTALGAASDKTEEALLLIKKKTETIDSMLEYSGGVIDDVAGSLERVESELKAVKESRDERAAYKTIMLSQVDMLYDIFMSSALPQYKKDEIGERIGAMREELKLCDESTK